MAANSIPKDVINDDQSRFTDNGFTYIGEVSICHYCNRRTGNRKCTAFPKGIPDSFWKGKADHTVPYDGDNGITFEPRTS